MDAPFEGNERFEVRDELGAGGFGRVFVAWDREHGQLVALKVLHRSDPRALRRFKGEFRTLANLAHPNLVNLYELHQADERWFFTMELVEGASFSDWLRPGTAGRHPSRLLTMPARPLARGLGADPSVASTWGATVEPEPSARRVYPEGERGPITRAGASDATASAGLPVAPFGAAELLARAGGRAPESAPESPRSSSERPTQTPLALPQAFFGIEAPDAETLAAWEATRPRSGGPAVTDQARLRRAFRQLVEALAWLHASGHLHRDIKPSNVLVDHGGVVKVLDFGLVTRLSGGEVGDLGERLAGTPAFIAPELCAGLPPSPASDWYSVGVMLYLALTGALPFTGELAELVLAKQALAPRPPSELAPVPRDLEDLCLALLGRNPLDRPEAGAMLEVLSERGAAARVTTGAWSRPAAVGFVGRRAEVQALARVVKGQRGEGPDIALVEGPSGLGKTALVDHVLAELQHGRAEPPLVLRSRCFERGSVRFRALDGAIDDLAHHLSLRGEGATEALLRGGRSEGAALADRAALARLFPALPLSVGGLDGDAAGPTAEAREAAAPSLGAFDTLDTLDTGDSRRRAFGALRDLLARVAAERDVVVAIDDAHWADEDSLPLLADLLRTTPLRWVLAFRSEERQTSPFLRALLQAVLPNLPAARVTSITLGPLAPPEARALAVAQLGGLGDEVALEPVLGEAGGHPLFIAELAHLRWRGLDEAALGRGLEGLLGHRVEALPQSARLVLELVAVAGEPIPARLVRASSGADQRELTLLTQDHLVSARPSAVGELVMCWHDRVREVVVRGLEPRARAYRHRALAEAADRLGFGDAPFRFEHWRLALPVAGEDGLRSRVVALGLEAARAASTAFAFDRAARIYEQVIALAPPTTPDLHERLGQSLVDAGRGALAARAFIEASRLAASQAEARRLELRAAEQYLFAGAFGEGEAVIRKVFGRVGLSVAQGVPGAMASFALESLRMRLRGMDFTPRPVGAIPPEELALVDTLWSGTIGLSMAKPLASQAFQQRHLRAALGVGEPLRVARALSIELAFSGLPGGNDDSKSRALSERGHAVARTLEHPYAEAFITMSDGGTHWLRGRWRAAQGAVEAALEVYRRECRGVTWEKDTANFVALSCLAHRGLLAELRSRLDEALADAMERGDLYLEVQLRTRFEPLVALMDGRPEAARDGIARALSRWTAEGYQIVHFWSYANRVQALLYAGRPADAWAEVLAGERPLKRSFMLMGQYYRVQHHELVARTALAAAASSPRPAALLARARASTAQLAREAMGWSLPMAALFRGLLEADPARSRRELLHARSGFLAADMGLHAAAAELVLARREGDAERVASTLSGIAALGVLEPEAFMRVFSGA